MNDSRIKVGINKVPVHLSSSQNRIFIKSGKVVNDDRMFESDIYIEDGIIKQLGTNLMIPGGVRTVDAKGKYILPGGIDTNTHFQSAFSGMKTSDDFYSGTKAALSGGTTTILDCVFTKPGASILESFKQYREIADGSVCCDYGLRVLVPQVNDKTLQEVTELAKNNGVNSFVGDLAHAERGIMLSDDGVYDLMTTCRSAGALLQIHAENGKMIERKAKEIFNEGITGPEGSLYSRPEEFEYEATNRSILIADQTRCPLYLLNQTGPSAVLRVAESRGKGGLVFSETTAAAIADSGEGGVMESNWRTAAGCVTHPPLRGGEAAAQLLSYVGGGVIQCVASQHAMYRADQKALGKDDFRLIPPGLNGVEERMSVLWEKAVNGGHVDPCQFVAVTSTNAAKIFNLYPRKGRIEQGSDADVVIWDPARAQTLSFRSSHNNQKEVDFSVFEGVKCEGGPDMVISGGRVVLESGEVKVIQGVGKFLSLQCHTPYLYSRLQAKKSVMKPLERIPYNGPVAALTEQELSAATLPGDTNVGLAANTEDSASNSQKNDFHQRPPTRSGGRHMQDSSFSLSGSQIDDSSRNKSSIRTHQPPGGASTSLW